MSTTRQRGTLGEDFAAARLREDGYEILARNWRSGHYEIDLIAQKAQVVAFIEVKTRAADALTAPAAALGKAQRRRIALAAVAYLKQQGIYSTGAVQPRFDIFEVVTERAGSPAVARYYHMTAAYDMGGLHVFI